MTLITGISIEYSGGKSVCWTIKIRVATNEDVNDHPITLLIATRFSLVNVYLIRILYHARTS